MKLTLFIERPGLIVWDSDFQGLQIEDKKISLTGFKQFVNEVLEAAEILLSKELMFDSTRVDVGLSSIQDVMTKPAAHFSFLDPAANGLNNGANEMMQQMRRMNANDEKQLIGRDGGWNNVKVQKYLYQKKQFLELLMLLFHITGGQPGRGSELGSIKFRNNQKVKRNFYVLGGKAFYYTEYHKARASSNVSYHVVRYLPRRVGELAVLYLTYVRPLANLLYNQGLSTMNGFDGHYIFCSDETNDVPWNGKQLTDILRRETNMRMGVELGISLYRHLIIGITRIHVKKVAGNFEGDNAAIEKMLMIN